MTIAVPFGTLAGNPAGVARTSASGMLSRLASGCAAAALRRWHARQLRTALAETEARMLDDVGLMRTPAGHVVHL